MRYAAVAAPRTTRVLKGRAASSETSNMPATTVVPRCSATAAQLGGERPVQRLGERAHVGAGLAEVTGERLRQHDQVGAVGHQVAQTVAVGHGIEARGLLDHRDPELSGGGHGSRLTPVTASFNAGSFNAVVLAGGTAARLDGVDKASVEHAGRTLLTWALDAVIDAGEVVVVGDPVPTERPVTFTREDPRHGGPVAAMLTGRDALLDDDAGWPCWPATCRT